MEITEKSNSKTFELCLCSCCLELGSKARWGLKDLQLDENGSRRRGATRLATPGPSQTQHVVMFGDVYPKVSNINVYDTRTYVCTNAWKKTLFSCSPSKQSSRYVVHPDATKNAAHPSDAGAARS